MKKNSHFVWIVALVFLVASLACNLPFLGGGEESPTAKPNSTGGSQATTAPGAPTVTRALTAAAIKPSETVKPTAKGPNPVPLPLRQGLSSLNSYRMTIHIVMTGFTKLDMDDNTTLIEHNSKTDSTHIRIVSISSSEDDPTPETSTTERYLIGGKSCEISDSGSSTTKPTAQVEESDKIARDLANSLSSLVDYNLSVENPVFVAEETLNGVLTNHYTFKVTQLGKDSGALVKQNSGEYWVAKDGQYLVKYSVILELSSDKAGTKVDRSELTIELTAINQTINIAFPANCKIK